MIGGSIFLLSWYLYCTTVNVQSGEVSWRFCRLYHVTCDSAHVIFSMCFESRVIFLSQLTRKFTTKCPTISRCTGSSTVFRVTSSLTRDLSDRNHVCDFIWEVLESSRNWLRYRESTIIKTTRPHKKLDPHCDSVHNPR